VVGSASRIEDGRKWNIKGIFKNPVGVETTLMLNLRGDWLEMNNERTKTQMNNNDRNRRNKTGGGASTSKPARRQNTGLSPKALEGDQEKNPRPEQARAKKNPAVWTPQRKHKKEKSVLKGAPLPTKRGEEEEGT